MPTPYTIQTGDTLSGLAAKNGVSTGALQAANPNITDINKIYAGSTLNIPAPLPASTVPTIQTTTGVRNSDLAAGTKLDNIIASRTPTGSPVVPATTQTTQTNTTPKSVTVTKTQDNADGTTTNFLSDGTQSIVRYTKNTDGSLTPVEVNSVNKVPAINQAENDYSTKIQAQIDNLDKQKASFDAELNTLRANNNSVYQSTIDSIKSTFESRRNQLKDTYTSLVGTHTKTGYQTDAFRYTPTHAEGLITNDEAGYVRDLSGLDAAEQGLLLQAVTAKNSKDWEAVQTAMTQFDKVSTQKADLLGKLLTSAQEQNKRIATEAKIAKDALMAPISAAAGTLADNVAAQVAKDIAGMSKTAQDKYIVKKATELNISPDILRSSVINQNTKNAKEERAINKSENPAPKKSDFLAALNSAMSDTNAKINGAPVIDANGFLTPAGYRQLVSKAFENGISKSEFLSQYSDKFYKDNLDAYGLTDKEKSQVGG